MYVCIPLNLKGMNDFIVKLNSITNKKSFTFEIKDAFFESFTYSDIEHVDVCAIAKFKKDGENIYLKLTIDGDINHLACDICTEELSVKIFGETNIIIKKTNEHKISTDEILYIANDKNYLDLKQLIYELIVLNAPKKRAHPLDKNGNNTCNKEMLDLITKYTQKANMSSDPRWDALKKLK